MLSHRLVVYLTAGFVVLTAAATAPQAGILAIPEGDFGGGAAPGSGSVDLEVVSAPDRATLQAGEYSTVHYLTVPDTTVTVSRVSGKPLLTVSIDVPALGFQRSSVFALGVRGERERSYGIERATINSSRLEQSTYEGTLSLVVRDDDGRTVVYRDEIDVEVVG